MSSPAENACIYRELDCTKNEIRLLVVRAGSSNGTKIKCDIRYISLKETPVASYETVSYAWGDPTKRDTIILNGSEVDVPASSAAVLRRMRDSKDDRLLWIDAVCINQKNVSERGQQVALMAEIYGKTTTNLIWLGEPSDAVTASRAHRAVIKVWKDAQASTDGFRVFGQTVFDRSTGAYRKIPGEIPGIGHWHHDALVSYFESSWFTRLWGKSTPL